MPYGKKYRKRQNYRRKRRYRHKKASPRAGALGLPISNIVRLRYSDTKVLDVSDVGGISALSFRANSCFDPDRSIGGHQPLTWDQITPFYNHYVVLGSKITIRAYDSASVQGSGVPQIVGIMLNDDASTPTTWSEVLEQRKAKYRILSYGQNAATVTNTFSAKKFFNVKDVKDNVNRIGASVFANPAEEAVFTIFSLPINAVTDTPAINVTVTIDYIVAMSEPKDIPTS